MADAVFRANPQLEQQVARSPEMATALEQVASRIAAGAERIAPDGYQYTTTTDVRDGRGEVRARAFAEGVGSSAGWIEFGANGTHPIPAHAPLRNAAIEQGLTLRDTK